MTAIYDSAAGTVGGSWYSCKHLVFRVDCRESSFGPPPGCSSWRYPSSSEHQQDPRKDRKSHSDADEELWGDGGEPEVALYSMPVHISFRLPTS